VKKLNLNVVLQTVNIVINLGTIITAYVFLIAFPFPALIDQGSITVLFVFALIIYFLFLFVLSVTYFPKDNLQGMLLIVSPLIVPLLTFLQGSADDLPWYFCQVGLNLYLAVVISGIAIVYFGPLLANQGWKAQKEFFKELNYVWLALSMFLVPAFLIGAGMLGLLIYTLMERSSNNGEFILGLIIWLGGLASTFIVYYRQLMAASIYADK
jgi:hypothetical protein